MVIVRYGLGVMAGWLEQVKVTVEHGLGAMAGQGLFLRCDILMRGSGIERHERGGWGLVMSSLSPDWTVLW